MHLLSFVSLSDAVTQLRICRRASFSSRFTAPLFFCISPLSSPPDTRYFYEPGFGLNICFCADHRNSNLSVNSLKMKRELILISDGQMLCCGKARGGRGCKSAKL